MCVRVMLAGAKRPLVAGPKRQCDVAVWPVMVVLVGHEAVPMHERAVHEDGRYDVSPEGGRPWPAAAASLARNWPNASPARARNGR